MYERHREHGPDDFHFYYIYSKAVFRKDRFDITGAGDYIDAGEMGNYMVGYGAGITDSSLKLLVARIAGAVYDAYAVRAKRKPKYSRRKYALDIFGLLEDDWGSTFYMRAGYNQAVYDSKMDEARK